EKYLRTFPFPTIPPPSLHPTVPSVAVWIRKEHCISHCLFLALSPFIHFPPPASLVPESTGPNLPHVTLYFVYFHKSANTTTTTTRQGQVEFNHLHHKLTHPPHNASRSPSPARGERQTFFWRFRLPLQIPRQVSPLNIARAT
ncbi:conserved hypothetical protein, partial [Ricinus communis]